MESTIIANSTDSQNHETTSAISSSIGGGDGGSPGGDGSDGGMGGIVGGDGGAGEGGDVIASSIYSTGLSTRIVRCTKCQPKVTVVISIPQTCKLQIWAPRAN